MAFGKQRIVQRPHAKYLRQKPTLELLDADAVVSAYLLVVPKQWRGSGFLLEGWIEANVKNPLSFERYKLFASTICGMHSISYMRGADAKEGFRHFDSRFEGTENAIAGRTRSVLRDLIDVFHIEPLPRTQPWYWTVRCYTETPLGREMSQAMKEREDSQRRWRSAMGEFGKALKGMRRQ